MSAEGPETPESRPIRVVIVDDHPLWRDAVERDLTAAGLDVVGTASNGDEAIARTRAVRPDLVVLDLQIPAPTGAEVAARLVGERPELKILVLSASGESADVFACVKAGATGYLVKSASREELLEAVHRVAAGVPVFSPGLAAMMLGEFQQRAAPAEPAPNPLTDRETEILKLVAKGLSYREIAERLVISHRTVQNHVQSTLTKLQMNNRVQLTRYALEHGLDD